MFCGRFLIRHVGALHQILIKLLNQGRLSLCVEERDYRQNVSQEIKASEFVVPGGRRRIRTARSQSAMKQLSDYRGVLKSGSTGFRCRFRQPRDVGFGDLESCTRTSPVAGSIWPQPHSGFGAETERRAETKCGGFLQLWTWGSNSREWTHALIIMLAHVNRSSLRPAQQP